MAGGDTGTGAPMFRSIWAIALLVLAGAEGRARAEPVVFPPFMHSTADTGTMFAPKCAVTGRRMSCELLYVSVFPWGGETGRCYLQLSAQSHAFTRSGANSWAAEITSPFCRTKTLFRLAQSTETPKRVTLSVTVEVGEKTEECQKSAVEMRKGWPGLALVLEWTEGDPDRLLPFPMPAACKSWVTGPGQFPGGAFPR